RVLGLLWQDGPLSPRWFFSKIENGSLTDPLLMISGATGEPEISNDSLWTQISQADGVEIGGPNTPTNPSIRINVFTMLNDLWRSEGVLLSDGKILAIWSSGSAEGMSLFSGVIDMTNSHSASPSADDSELDDVTRNTLLVYGGDRGEAGQR